MNGPPIWQRLLAALAYTLPWSDALGFGSSLLSQFPWLNLLILPALPMHGAFWGDAPAKAAATAASGAAR